MHRAKSTPGRDRPDQTVEKGYCRAWSAECADYEGAKAVLLAEERARRIEHLHPRKSLILEQKNFSSVRPPCPLNRVNCPVRCMLLSGGVP